MDLITEQLPEKLREIEAELYIANLQSLPTDDQIIMDHVREALRLTKDLLQQTKEAA